MEKYGALAIRRSRKYIVDILHYDIVYLNNLQQLVLAEFAKNYSVRFFQHLHVSYNKQKARVFFAINNGVRVSVGDLLINVRRGRGRGRLLFGERNGKGF
jgi:hypothetical protein